MRHQQTPAGGDVGDLLKMPDCHGDSSSQSPTQQLSYLNTKESAAGIQLAPQEVALAWWMGGVGKSSHYPSTLKYSCPKTEIENLSGVGP